MFLISNHAITRRQIPGCSFTANMRIHKDSEKIWIVATETDVVLLAVAVSSALD
jgi:hypothetical protein